MDENTRKIGNLIYQWRSGPIGNLYRDYMLCVVPTLINVNRQTPKVVYLESNTTRYLNKKYPVIE